MNTGFEDTIEGMVDFAIPIKAKSRDLQAAIRAVGLTRQVLFPSTQEFSLDNSFSIIYKYITAK